MNIKNLIALTLTLTCALACDAEPDTDFRAADYCVPAEITQEPTTNPHEMDIRQRTDDAGPGWADPSSCFCMDPATGQPFSGLCGEEDCSKCCAAIGGWWPGCSIWPWMTGC